MTAFFVQTDRCVSGPFTGVELREAALAGIIGPHAVVGGSQQGPWFRATDIGLFSEKMTPLPHPPGTHIPHYQVRGMSSAFQGPFKLRELIGFAARGMLPADALVRSDCSDAWVRARRYSVIAACLNGELVLTDGTGKIVLRSSVLAKKSKPADEMHGAVAPIEIAKAVDAREIAKVPPPPPISKNDVVAVERPKPKGDDPAEREITTPPSRLARMWSNCVQPIREGLSGLIGNLARPRIAIQLTCLLLIFAGVSSAFSFWRQISMPRGQAIGDWVGMSSDHGEPSFGISLRADGRCIVFNMQGKSWNGDFDWVQRVDDTDGFDQIAPFSTVFDQLGPTHQSGPIKPTDGYIRLSGFVKEPPMIDGHPVRDLFLRREGDQLQLGYLTSVHWTKAAKTMEAGWMTATKLNNQRPDVNGRLQTIEQELPVPTADFGGRRPLHISKAIEAVREGQPSRSGDAQATMHETLTYSNKVNAAYLLRQFGMPDEARSLFPFEFPEMGNGPSFEGAQLVRYGDLKFFLSHDGQLLYLALVAQPML